MYKIDEQGNITIIQGDTFNYNISGIVINEEKKDVVVFEYDETNMTSISFNGSIIGNALTYKIADVTYKGFTRDVLSDIELSGIKYLCYTATDGTKKYCVTEGYTYKTFFSVYDSNRNTIFQVESTVSKGNSTFKINKECSDLLVVKRNEETATYYFAVKLCELTEQTEDTLSIAGGDFETLNTITVYPKKVEGI